MSKKDKVEDIAIAYIAAAKAERAAKKEKDLLASQLMLLVPAEETMHGVKHVLESKGSPSWKGICEKVIKDLVPKSKASVVEEIILANTSKPREYIRAVAED